MNKTSTAPGSTMLRVGIVGVSGYSGIELCRLIACHPSFRLATAVSDKWAGTAIGDRLPVDGEIAAVRIQPQAETAAAVAGLDLVFLCTPAEASLELAPAALDAGARVVDLSGAFRLPVNEYPRWYGFTHPRPDLLLGACYSMPEAGVSGDLPSARLVSNPGCYATAGALGAGAARSGRSPRWRATFTPIGCCATSTRPRSSARWPSPIRVRSR